MAGDKGLKCKLLACNCEGTMALDGKKLAKMLGLSEPLHVYNHLCRAQVGSFEKALADAGDEEVLVTCTQEAPLFSELAAEQDFDALSFVNIREMAGWSSQGAKAHAKIAGLISEAMTDVEPVRLMDVKSGGSCVVYGSGQEAVDVATRLAGLLNVSLILAGGEADNADIMTAPVTGYPVSSGTISQLSGSLGKFVLTVDGYGAAVPSSRSALAFGPQRDGVSVACDLVFDMRKGDGLLGGGHGRDGYVRVDPGRRAQVAGAMFDIAGLAGEFEKPLYVTYDQSICAHSRSGKVGCSHCIDQCPASAISSDGDGIVVDTGLCDGCGHCAAGCPAGAVSFSYPDRQGLVARCQALVSGYLAAGGKRPVLLVHEEEHGFGVISALARYGNGLAANVLALSVSAITRLGHDELCAFMTCAVQSIVVLAPVRRRDEMATLEREIGLCNTLLAELGYDSGAGAKLLVADDPDALAEMLDAIGPVRMPAPKGFVAGRNKRENARLAISNLRAMAGSDADVIALPETAPYGRIVIDGDACTLCLSCVGACPAGALGDNQERPQVSFSEAACVQCGLCRATCPENAISLEARYNFATSALSPVVLYEEDPLECSRCGKAFGSKSAIEKVISILAGKNPMFKSSEQLALLKMCDNCRIIAMAETPMDPMAMGEVPRPRTAEDYDDEDEDEPVKH